MDTRKKWITVNGVLKKNPAYQGGSNTVSTLTNPNALTIVSNIVDTEGMALSEATSSSISIIQDQDFLQEFCTNDVSGDQILEGLSSVFDQYEIPIGSINKVLDLQENNLNFIIDDSPSMKGPSDVAFANASDYIKNKYDPQGIKSQNPNNKLTRWQEAEDRLYIFSQILKFIPVHQITITFLNRTETITLDRRGKSVDQFSDDMVKEINRIFNTLPRQEYRTPLYKKLSEEYSKQRAGRTRHYVLTDGEPTDCSEEQFTDLIVFRGQRPTGTFDQIYQIVESRSNNNPTSLLSCTNGDAAMLKRIEGIALFTSEHDDYPTEKKEVQAAQGQAFPYSRGMDLICQLVAPTNPYDYDAFDEYPLTKSTLDNVLGRVHSDVEYDLYLSNNPMRDKIPQDKIHLFRNANVMAHQILGEKHKKGIQQYLAEHPNVQPPHGFVNNYANTNTYQNSGANYQSVTNQWQAQPPSGYASTQNPYPYNTQQNQSGYHSSQNLQSVPRPQLGYNGAPGYQTGQNPPPYNPQAVPPNQTMHSSMQNQPPYNSQVLPPQNQSSFGMQNTQYGNTNPPPYNPQAIPPNQTMHSSTQNTPPYNPQYMSQQNQSSFGMQNTQQGGTNPPPQYNPNGFFANPANRPPQNQPSTVNQQGYTPRRGW